MAVKASNQMTLVDVTDAYSVVLTSESYTFVGGTSGVGSGSSCSTQAVAFCGTNQCSAVTVDASAITCPTGISATVENSGSSAPTITFTTTATVSAACEATIPVTVDGITINKKFSFAVAKTGATGNGIKSTATTYQVGTSGTDVPTGTWSDSVVATTEEGQYLWTRTITTYTNGTTATSYTVAAHGSKGEKGDTGSSTKWYTGTAITGTSTTATVFSNSGITSAIVGDMYLNTSTNNTYRCTTAGAASAAKWVYVNNIKGTTGTTGSQWYSGTAITGTSTTATVFSSSGITSARVNDMYLNTSTGNTYKCTTAGAASAAKWVYAGSIKGTAGADGDDAITVSITTSNGSVFKNSTGSTVLTANVYVGGTACDISDAGAVTLGSTSIGTIKWYKGTSTTAAATAATLTVSATDVESVATYTCQLEA